jgi:hypothetical protein
MKTKSWLNNECFVVSFEWCYFKIKLIIKTNDDTNIMICDNYNKT